VPAEKIAVGGKVVDISQRAASSNTVVGSPALAAETVVCQVTGLPSDTAAFLGVFLTGVASFTVGTAGTAVTLRLRTGTTAGAGTVVATTGALTGGIAATNLVSQDLQGLDTAATGGAQILSQSYCLTLQVTSGAAASTVSQTNLIAIVF
jgi:hypothetical protein